MQKIYFLFLLLFSIESISAFIKCGNPDENDECNRGITVYFDDLDNVPDSCCKVYIYKEAYNPYQHNYLEYEEDVFCLQMQKSKASDYAAYIRKEHPYLSYPNKMTITCDSEVVYDSDLSSYIKTLNLWALFLFLLC